MKTINFSIFGIGNTARLLFWHNNPQSNVTDEQSGRDMRGSWPVHIWIMGIILLLPESGSAHLFLRSDFKRRAVMKQSEYPGWNHPAVSPDRLPVSTCMQWKESSLMREQWRNLLRREGPDKGPSPFFCRPSGAAAAAAGGAESGCRGGGNRHRQSLAAGFRWLGRNVRRVGGVR